jgi:hypothetical protein
MAGPFTVVVLIVAGHEPEAATQALVRAVHDAMGPSVLVDVSETPVEPDGDEAVAFEASAHANALAEVQEDEEGGRRVRLRVHVAGSDRWLERQIAFEASDADSERGRTLGYVLAAMLPSRAPEASLEPPPPTVAPAASPAPRPTATSAGTGETPRPARGSTPSLAFDVVALATTAFDAAANALGGGVTAQWFPQQHVSLRLGFTTRGGTVEAANGSTLDFAGVAGLEWHPWRALRGGPLGLAFRADYLCEYQSLTHYPTGIPGDLEATQSRWVSAVDAFADGSVRVADGLELVVGLGIEDAFRPIDVEVGGTQVATIPALRAVAETGLRIEF